MPSARAKTSPAKRQMACRLEDVIRQDAHSLNHRNTAGAWLRINLAYVWRHGRLPRLDSPTHFTEFVQIRKLNDRNPLLPLYADKVKVKNLVAAAIGSQWIIPTLWHGRELPDVPQWPMPFVVKSRHGCNQCEFVRSARHDWLKTRRNANSWVKTTYGRWLDEWLYSEIEHGLLVEPFVGSDGVLPIDYKFYVFGGRVEFVQVHLERERNHRWIVLDREWRRVSQATADDDPVIPAALSDMIEAAETLGEAFDFVRVDFFEIGGRPLFGELCFYPGSGLDRFSPVALDELMGSLWRTAKSPAI